MTTPTTQTTDTSSMQEKLKEILIDFYDDMQDTKNLIRIDSYDMTDNTHSDQHQDWENDTFGKAVSKIMSLIATMTTPTNREAVDWEDLDVKNWSSFSNWETWKLWLTMDELTEHEYLRIFSLCKAIEKQAIRQTHLDLLREVEQKITESKSPFNVGASEIAQAADNGWWQAIFDLTRKLKSIKEKYER